MTMVRNGDIFLHRERWELRAMWLTDWWWIFIVIAISVAWQSEENVSSVGSQFSRVWGADNCSSESVVVGPAPDQERQNHHQLCFTLHTVNISSTIRDIRYWMLICDKSVLKLESWDKLRSKIWWKRKLLVPDLVSMWELSDIWTRSGPHLDNFRLLQYFKTVSALKAETWSMV